LKGSYLPTRWRCTTSHGEPRPSSSSTASSTSKAQQAYSCAAS
jgi:hypothetical protein